MAAERDDYEIAILCALALEAEAVKSMFDDDPTPVEVETATQSEADENSYSTGVMNGRKVVLVHLAGEGKINASAAASHLKHSFKNIKLALIVGICGGVPSEEGKIRLGDVIIGKKVLQYDYGRQHEHKFLRKEGQSRQSLGIRSFVGKLESGKGDLEGKLSEYLEPVLEKLNPEKYNGLKDTFYPPISWHMHNDLRKCSGDKCKEVDDKVINICEAALQTPCEVLGCEEGQTLDRKERPSIHFGSIASGDSVVRSAAFRDAIAKEESVIGFDMEAAAVWDHLPCVPVKGVCDYADGHKEKSWQIYAATAAAAATKSLLEKWGKADEPSNKFQIKNQFNNYNSRILNQADQIHYSGSHTFNLS